MYYKQVKLDDAAQKVYDQLRVAVAKNRPDPDDFIEQLRQIINARALLASVNELLRSAIDEDPRDADAIEDVIDATSLFAEQCDSDAKFQDWHDELERCANHYEIRTVSEDDMPQRAV